MRDVMNRLLRDLEPGNNLTICIHGNRGFQESFPGLSGSPGIAETCIGTGKSGRTDSRT